jgi:Dolichyl-phosphate-mannose-protein mannosyltransferase
MTMTTGIVNRKLFLLIPIILSAFTNLWNPVGFPAFHVDEGIYMGRAMHTLQGGGPLEETEVRTPYDHPFFGQIFLGAALGLVGYPDFLQPSADGDVHSIENLFLVPRILMGLLAVADTFLIYKIAERRYNRNVAFIAAILFAVMPITWILRRILLDNISLSFLLSSILFALYVRKSSQKYNNNSNTSSKNAIIAASISGIFLGLAIFTKIPAFTFIPLVGFFVFMNSNRSLKLLGLWFIPVIMIPSIWPIYSIAVNQFDDWTYGVEFQSRKEGKPLAGALKFFFEKDPILLLLGLAGVIFAAIKRDFLILLWAIPIFLFFYIVSWVSYFHLSPIIALFCVSAAPSLAYLFEKIERKKALTGQLFKFAVISSIAIFGFVCLCMLVATNVNSGFFRLYSFIVDYLQNYGGVDNVNHINNMNNDVSLLVGRYWTEIFVWIPEYVFDKDIKYIKETFDFGNILEELDKSRNIIFLVDRGVAEDIKDGNENLDLLNGNTDPIITIDDKGLDEHDRSAYPYNSLYVNRDIGSILVKANS